MPDRIITHHVSPYHAVQGTSAQVRRIVGRLPGDPPEFWNRCEECHRPIGYTHQLWCPEDGIVTEAQTYGGRHVQS
jgi:hypothetical protein